MTLGDLATAATAAREAERKVGNAECYLDGVAILHHAEPLPDDLSWLGDLRDEVTQLHAKVGFVGFFYRGLASRPAFLGGYAQTEIGWQVFRVPGSDDRPHRMICQRGTFFERGAPGEVNLLGHLLAVAANVDAEVSQAVLKGGAP